ncbi:hypothetical protein A2164_03470 [Candidatus Curtissbacteria bacterium RBG_13_35_7]|uniref:Uncharacterized protein n=1 Tax=Candidatus Curtissbacteria bacterium RBG_13_35_7 TaxID=1797705 RepID=A0A1F5G411_9BACT|nr:MAG: hypothetical protein A2164_03470 [Candidatus Curtissbacteria bacterium RBG_13_35_7]
MIDSISQINSNQANFGQSKEFSHGHKITTVILQISIASFTICLVWFAFIYYPQIVKKFQKVGLPQTKVILNIEATSGSFPIETALYTIKYEKDSNTYYAFINGANSAEFVDNKNSATLALKSLLSVESICNLNVIFASTAGLDLPRELKRPTNCY